MRKLILKFLVPFFLVLWTTRSMAQDSIYPICVCCEQFLASQNNDYVHLFNPKILKANGIKKLTIYTTSKQATNPSNSTFKIVNKEYREMIFNFNSEGYVIKIIVFNRLGKYHSSYDFKRDNNNKILVETFHYLDSIGEEVDFLSQQWIYKYKDGRLVMIKELDNKLKEQPDSLSNYTIYDYDAKGRVILEKKHYYYSWDDPKSSQNRTEITYDNLGFNSTSSVFKESELLYRVKSKYTTNKKILNQKTYSAKKNDPIRESIYKYNNRGQLIKFQIIDPSRASECPDGNNFEDTYSYSSLQLINKVIHHYKNTYCELRFVYQ